MTSLCQDEQLCRVQQGTVHCAPSFPLPEGEYTIKARFSAATRRLVQGWLQEQPKQEQSARLCVKLPASCLGRSVLQGTIEAVHHASGGGNAVMLPQGWFVLHTHPNECNSTECDIEQPSAQDIKIAFGDFGRGHSLAHYVVSRQHVYRLSFHPRVQGDAAAGKAIVAYAERLEASAKHRFSDTGKGAELQHTAMSGLRRLRQLGCHIQRFPLSRWESIVETMHVVVGGSGQGSMASAMQQLSLS